MRCESCRRKESEIAFRAVQLFAPLSDVVPDIDFPNLSLGFPVLVGKEFVVPGLIWMRVQIDERAAQAPFMVHLDTIMTGCTEMRALFAATHGA